MRGTRTLTTSIAAAPILAAGTPVVLAQQGTAAVLDEIDAPAVQAGGMPAVHELSGEEFGTMIAELARSAPGAVVDHVRTFTPSTAPDDGLGCARSELEEWPAHANAIANARRGGVGRP